MIWIIIILLILSVGYSIYYRWQIYDLNRQLTEIQSMETNQLLTQEIYTKELDLLIEEINQTIMKERKIRIELLRKEHLSHQLMTNLSHDVRTPLTSLSGYLQLLEESQSPEDRDRYFRIIHNRLQRLQEMLDELFLYMKLEDGSFNVEMNRLELNELFRQELLSYYDNLSMKGIEPQIEMSEESIWIQGNPALIQRIISNLLKNILDHGTKDFSISLQKDTENQQAIITLINTMTSPFQGDPNILTQRFYQRDAARSSGNSGLGLSIVKSAIEKHHGQMQLSSEGKLFIIKIELPLIQ